MPTAEHAAVHNPVADHGHDGSRGVAADLRTTFDTGRTRPLAWRRAQLAGLAAMLTDHEQAVVDAVRADMGKPVLEAWMTEVAASRSDAEDAIRNLESWTAPRRAPTPLRTRPGRSAVHLDPSGSCTFGGVGESGMGAYHGRVGVDALSHHKAVLRKPAGFDVPLLYPPHRPWKQTVIRRAI